MAPLQTWLAAAAIAGLVTVLCGRFGAGAAARLLRLSEDSQAAFRARTVAWGDICIGLLTLFAVRARHTRHGRSRLLGRRCVRRQCAGGAHRHPVPAGFAGVRFGPAHQPGRRHYLQRAA